MTKPSEHCSAGFFTMVKGWQAEALAIGVEVARRAGQRLRAAARRYGPRSDHGNAVLPLDAIVRIVEAAIVGNNDGYPMHPAFARREVERRLAVERQRRRLAVAAERRR